VSVARAQGDAALSLRDVVTLTLAASAVTAFVFTSPITLMSLNDTVALHGSASASTDIPTVRSVVWRYRMLPTAATGDVSDDFTNAQLG
jgi:hypothetical protein